MCSVCRTKMGRAGLRDHCMQEPRGTIQSATPPGRASSAARRPLPAASARCPAAVGPLLGLCWVLCPPLLGPLCRVPVAPLLPLACCCPSVHSCAHFFAAGHRSSYWPSAWRDGVQGRMTAAARTPAEDAMPMSERAQPAAHPPAAGRRPSQAQRAARSPPEPAARKRRGGWRRCAMVGNG